ncbi:MAG: hypothetical protein KJ583_02335 [Nanoarchaeota archaeon]|nr:hypothetical protein [Nanoarchaeota archaeon]MBU1270409.1 hypothetical protein [Nanoarchaeota archaeon]MBU1604133.1 hypothetical protein [Nanoarchaeota archaeon]MBU2443444.1 hypothetical protein [Nanoarchaeota archaeon]
MRTLKQFAEFVQIGIVKKVSVNKERAKSLIIESERKIQSLNEHLEKIGIKNENANDYVEYCYDILLFLLRATLYLKGYSTSGQGAHEAEVSYLRVLGLTEKETGFANQMRYFRNGILYYGTTLDEEYAKQVIEFTKRIYPKIKELAEGLL